MNLSKDIAIPAWYKRKLEYKRMERAQSWNKTKLKTLLKLLYNKHGINKEPNKTLKPIGVVKKEFYKNGRLVAEKRSVDVTVDMHSAYGKRLWVERTNEGKINSVYIGFGYITVVPLLNKEGYKTRKFWKNGLDFYEIYPKK